MPQPRVLILHPALAPYRVDMFNALARRCALRVVFLSEAVANQAFDQARLRAQLVEPPGYLLRGLTVAGRTVRLGIGEELRRHRPDVVVTSEFGQATLGVLASRRLAGGDFGHVVATEDNPSSVLAETWLHGLGRRLLQPHVDCVLTYSEEARALYRGRFRASQPVVASPLVQDERVLGARLDEAAGVARAEAAARGLAGRRVLLYVGRLAPEKRVDRLIDAVGRLGAAWPDLRLALLGDGEERARLTARAGTIETELGRLVGSGQLRDLASADDMAAAWGALDIDGQRAVIGLLCEVRIYPAGQGARAFDPETVQVEWRA